MRNRYTMVKTDVIYREPLRNDAMFEKLLSEGILLTLRDLGYLCEAEYRRVRDTVAERLMEQCR